jgi:hypothetical protein
VDIGTTACFGKFYLQLVEAFLLVSLPLLSMQNSALLIRSKRPSTKLGLLALAQAGLGFVLTPKKNFVFAPLQIKTIP